MSSTALRRSARGLTELLLKAARPSAAATESHTLPCPLLLGIDVRLNADGYGASAAELTIFSFCSLATTAATSPCDIARLPNCRRNSPPLTPSTIEA